MLIIKIIDRLGALIRHVHLHLYVVGVEAAVTVCHVAIESHMVLGGGNTAIDRPGVGRRNLELGCQSKRQR